MAIGAVLRGTAVDFTSLLAFTFVFGVGFGWTLPNLPKLVSVYVPKEKANVAMGVVNAGFPVGTALGMAITVPVILPAVGTYQGVFLVWSIFPVAAAVLWWILVKEPRTRASGIEGTGPSVRGFRVALMNRNLWLVAGLMFLHQFFMWSWTGWAPVMMMLKGATPEIAGVISSITIWVVLPTFLLMPRLSHRLGVRRPFLWVPAIALALASWGARYASVSASWGLMVLVGVAAGTRFTMLLTLPIELMHEREVGMASGMVLSLGFLGGVVGPLIGGRILDATQNLDLSLTVLVVTSLVAAFIASRVPETAKARKS
jgi:CP family cyanate transporter-like MFS transporter